MFDAAPACVHDLSPKHLRQLQADCAHAHGVTPYLHDRLSDGSPGPELAVIPPGVAEIGAAEAERRFGDLPQRYQVIAKAYTIGRHAVTAEDFSRYAAACGFVWRDDLIRAEGRQPVINISQRQAMGYLEWLSGQTGRRYRLPNEVEWEYAARAGSPNAYCFGERLTCGDANVQTFQASGTHRLGWRRFLPFCAPLNRAVEVAVIRRISGACMRCTETSGN